MTDLALAELARERRALFDAVKLHKPSLERFWPRGRPWFALNLAERDEPEDEHEDGRPRHLSTSASCFESLADQTPSRTGLSGSWGVLADTFSQAALGAEVHNWRSEGAAEVYCRVRALPAVLNLAQSLDATRRSKCRQLLVDAWETVPLEQPARAGLAERSLFKDDGSRADAPDARSPGYPPNAFLTYWGLKAHQAYADRRAAHHDLPKLAPKVEARRQLALAWCEKTLARQAAVVLGGGERIDPQQLAYALPPTSGGPRIV